MEHYLLSDVNELTWQVELCRSCNRKVIPMPAANNDVVYGRERHYTDGKIHKLCPTCEYDFTIGE